MWLRVVGRVVGALVILVILAVAGVYGISSYQLNRHYETPPVPPAAVAAATPSAVERGKHLATAITKCTECHGDNLAGLTVIDNAALGHIHASNLTRGKGGVGATYTTADLIRAIRQGVKHDGTAIAFMPVSDFASLSDADVGAIAAYVESIAPVNHVQPSTRLGPVGRALLVSGTAPIFAPARHYAGLAPSIPAVPTGPTVSYGEYLAHVGGCIGCHGDRLEGGPVPGGDPSWPPAPSINADGLRGWSEGDFDHALTTGQIPGGRTLNTAMPWRYTRYMTPEEMHAVWLYLTSVKPTTAN